MATLIEMAGRLVAAHAAKNALTTAQLLQELGRVHTTLKGIECGLQGEGPATRALTLRDAFKKDEVVCMICRKGGFQTLGRHLSHAHQMSPSAYRKQFGIPAEQSLCSQSFSDSRRQMALDLGLADILAAAREVRLEKIRLKKEAFAKSAQAAKSKSALSAKPRSLHKVKAAVTAGAGM